MYAPALLPVSANFDEIVLVRFGRMKVLGLRRRHWLGDLTLSDQFVRFMDASIWLQRRELVLQEHGEALFPLPRAERNRRRGRPDVCFNRPPYLEWHGL